MINADLAIKRLVQLDPALAPHTGDIRLHIERYNRKRRELGEDKPLSEIANGHLYFGFHRTECGWVFREWLPGADAVYLTGDFNSWQRYTHPLISVGGTWEIALDGEDALRHGQCVKLIVRRGSEELERIPAFIRRTVMDERTWRLCGVISDSEPFPWSDGRFYKKHKIKTPLIYEAHIGMATERDGVGTYAEFVEEVLPRIKRAGYNVIQLMAIAEHPYYASFGYQVTNLFAPSCRYGAPEELKALINSAHRMGIAVVLDVVHSHACPNEGEGLHRQDGTEGQYFLEGERGWHPAWKTRLFNYENSMTLHLLLSNLKYWQDEFHFDGFRFDGVTSMLYENHGLGTAFTSYSQYYSPNTNVDARVYLTLANELIHEVNPRAITIAEDMSGMPAMCLPIKQGGFGFDYRLSMGVPDMWIKLIKECPLESWDMGYIWSELTMGRPKERSVAYAESHDQAMVGDKTIIFRLADAEMYTGMEKSYHTPTMDNAIDYHKLIRLLTASTADGGYLNFMGNEFGHPEWIDFPREGNGWSYHYARRQWSLVDNGGYKFSWLGEFDRAMIEHIREGEIYSSGKPTALFVDGARSTLVFERGGYIYVFNMHPTVSRTDVFVSAEKTGKGAYRVVFSTDDEAFGGQGRIQNGYIY